MSVNESNPNRLITREPLSGSHKIYERSDKFKEVTKRLSKSLEIFKLSIKYTEV